VLLDHLTRGRVMLGCGPGALPSDAYMMGIDPLKQRHMMDEALEAIVALLADDDPVTMRTEWFTLNSARLQLRPFSPSGIEMAVAAQISPSGPRAAGRFGLGLLSLGATTAGGFDVLASHWQVMEERASEFGTTVDRQRWRLVGPMHIAPTEEQARAEVAYGLADWVDYFQRVAALPIAPATAEGADLVDALNETGLAVIGTPEMAVAQLQRLVDQSGGFGAYLFMAHEWADRLATLRSYELVAQEVMPLFQDASRTLVRSRDWAGANRETFIGSAVHAVMQSVQEHYAEREARRG
jgi:limonene 1,2-monooxygenase